MRSYRLVGAYLTAVGLALTLTGLLLTGLIIHEAMGISCLILGVTLLITPVEERWRAVSRGLAMMLMDSYANLERLLKELDLRGPAVYVRVGEPPSVRAVVARGRVNPPRGDAGLLHPREDALLLVPPGRTILAYARDRGLTPGEGGFEVLEQLLTTCLVEVSEVCRGVMVKLAGDELVVSIEEPLGELLEVSEPFPRASECLGSPYASAVAAAAAYVLGRGVQVAGEELRGNRLVVRLRLYEEG